jgi:hypothetical protein
VAAICAIGQTERVIRNVVIHQQGQLPLVADVRELPSAGDANLICTNVRTADGKRPQFIDASDAWFLIPLVTVRFIEVPRASMAAAGAPDDDASAESAEEAAPEAAPADEGPEEPDEDLLARIRDL